MKKAITAIAVFGCLALYAGKKEHGGHGAGGAEPAKYTGEVMDMTCYIAHPENGQGKEHAKCAKTCIQKGLPVGLLDSAGTLYLISGTDHKSANKMMAPHAGKIVSVMATEKEQNGVKLLLVTEVMKK